MNQFGVYDEFQLLTGWVIKPKGRHARKREDLRIQVGVCSAMIGGLQAGHMESDVILAGMVSGLFRGLTKGSILC